MFLMLSLSEEDAGSSPRRRASAPTATTKMLASRRRRSAPATRQPKPARRSVVAASAAAILRYETGYFCAEEEPSYRVFVVRYGLTFAFVTNSRPVFVSEGATSPPDSL